MDLKGPQKVAPEASETPKMAIFGAFGALVPFYGGPKFGPISIKIGQIVRITKKNDPEQVWAVCSLGREGNKWPKIRFLLYKHPKTVIPS